MKKTLVLFCSNIYFASHKNFLPKNLYSRQLILPGIFKYSHSLFCVKSSIIPSTFYVYLISMLLFAPSETSRLARFKLSRHEEVLSDERIRAYRIISSSMPAMQTYKRRHNEPLARQCRWQWPIGRQYALSHRKPKASWATLKCMFPNALTLRTSFNHRLSMDSRVNLRGI